METKYIYLADVARIIGKSRATAYRLIRDGKLIPHYKTNSPRTPLFREEDVLALNVIGPKEVIFNVRLHREAKERDHYRCVICHSDHKVVAHHAKPMESGGEDCIENLVTLCFACHMSIHRKGRSLMVKGKKHKTLAVAIWLIQQAGHSLP